MSGIRFCIVVLALGAAATIAVADDADKLAGTWTAQDAAGRSWTFASQNDTLKITHRNSSGAVSEFECKADGRNCKSGKDVTVSLWYNGPVLVELETKGSDVTKRRFTVASSGDTMQMEVMPIVPPGKAETVQFKRVQEAANKQ